VMGPRLLCWALLALLWHHASTAVGIHIIYDEALWTKQNWEQYKIDPGIWGHLNPSDDIIKDLDLLSVVQKTAMNSLDGPMPRRTSRPPMCVTSSAHCLCAPLRCNASSLQEPTP
jgi:hypothetical protein